MNRWQQLGAERRTKLSLWFMAMIALTSPFWRMAVLWLYGLFRLDPCIAIKSQPGGLAYGATLIVVVLIWIAACSLLSRAVVGVLAVRAGDLTREQAMALLWGTYPESWLQREIRSEPTS